MKPTYQDEQVQLWKGDCLEAMRELEAGCADAVIADLPYGTTQNKWDSIIPLSELWKRLNRITKPTAVKCFTAAQPFSSVLTMSNLAEFKYELIWDKVQITGFLNSKRQPLRRHENVLVFQKVVGTYNPQFTQGEPYSIKRKHATDNYGAQRENSTVSDGRRYPTSIVTIAQKREKDGHPTQKPVELMEWLINTYTNEGDVVLDCTAGSFTTGIACLNTNRKFIGIERDEKYFELGMARMLKRIEELKPSPPEPSFVRYSAYHQDGLFTHFAMEDVEVAND